MVHAQQGATSIVLQVHWDNSIVLGAARTQSNNGAASTWVTTWCSCGTRYINAKHWDNNSMRSSIVMMGATWCNTVRCIMMTRCSIMIGDLHMRHAV